MPLAGLDAAGIEAKLAQAVAIGEQMPRSAHQSLEKPYLPNVVD